ncbi:MAG: hypothetical protein K0R54_5698 [Clostridiaceae bacterium]|jgi:hypothetical protein|nr:hypothetical protein [Clostridiaceae bacterium]
MTGRVNKYFLLQRVASGEREHRTFVETSP